MANWPGTKCDGPADRRRAISTRPSFDLSHRLDLVVVQREEEARQQLAVDVERQADRADRRRSSSAGPARVVERRAVEHAVEEAGRDEQPGGAVQRAPALVAAEEPAHVAHAGRVAGGDARARAAAPARPTASAAGSPTAPVPTSPIAPIAPSGPPSAVPCGLDERRMCGASSTRPVIATRRCQIAARSIPSNQTSTQGSVLISTRPIDSSRTDSAPRSWPTNEPAGCPAGQAASQSAASATTRSADRRRPHLARDELGAPRFPQPMIGHVPLRRSGRGRAS